MDDSSKEKEKKEKKEEKGFFGKKFFIGLGVTLGATAAAIGGKLAYDHFSKKSKDKKSIGESALQYKESEENDSILKKIKSQKSLKAKVIDNTYDKNYIRVNSITEVDEDEMKKKFKCPITQKIMEEPVITPYGTTYEKTAIIDWINKNKTDFVTKNALDENMLVTNYILKVAIKNYKETLN